MCANEKWAQETKRLTRKPAKDYSGYNWIRIRNIQSKIDITGK
jgi:hypothetical protein